MSRPHFQWPAVFNNAIIRYNVVLKDPECLGVPWMEVKPGFRDSEKVSHAPE